MVCFRQPHLDRSSYVFDRRTISIEHLYFRQIHRLDHVVVSTDTSSRSIMQQAHATSPRFLDNLHFEHFVKRANHQLRSKWLTKCSKWRLSKKGGLVAYACHAVASTDTNMMLWAKHFSCSIIHLPLMPYTLETLPGTAPF